MTETLPPPDDDEVIDDLDLLTLDELAKLWSVSKRFVEDLVYSKRLPSQKIGWNRRVPRAAAREYQREQAAAS